MAQLRKELGQARVAEAFRECEEPGCGRYADHVARGSDHADANGTRRWPVKV